MGEYQERVKCFLFSLLTLGGMTDETSVSTGTYQVIRWTTAYKYGCLTPPVSQCINCCTT